MDLNNIWNEVGKYLLAGGGLSTIIGLCVYYATKALLGKFASVNNSQAVADNIKKAIQGDSIKLAVSPFVQEGIDRIAKMHAKQVTQLVKALLEMKEDVKNITEAISYSKVIPSEIKEKLLKGEVVEIEQPEEVQIAELKIPEDKEPEQEQEAEQIEEKDTSCLYS